MGDTRSDVRSDVRADVRADVGVAGGGALPAEITHDFTGSSGALGWVETDKSTAASIVSNGLQVPANDKVLLKLDELVNFVASGTYEFSWVKVSGGGSMDLEAEGAGGFAVLEMAISESAAARSFTLPADWTGWVALSRGSSERLVDSLTFATP